MTKAVIIDNYDSFTYNLVYQVEQVSGCRPDVVRNDAIDFDQLDKYTHLILSPGPGLPKDAGQLMEVIERFYNKKAILGVCLGHQAIVECFGGDLINLDQVHHGVSAELRIIDLTEQLFRGMTDLFRAGRYHSWVAGQNNIPEELTVTCVDDEGEVMGVTHKTLPLKGVQFHPESILTEDGDKIIRNFLNMKF
jgi:anthranilate synthase component 2